MATKKTSKPKLPDRDVLMRFYDRYKHRDNFTGVDIGRKWSKGKRTQTQCLRFHVRHKIEESELESAEVMPTTFEGFDVDVIEGDYHQTPEGAVEAANQDRYAYLMGGMSCGRFGGGAGTLGCIVIDEATGQPGLVSNWHVIATFRAQVGDAVMQPAFSDAGLPGRDQVAVLQRWILDKDGDAAFARLTGARDWLPVMLDHFVPFSGARASRLGEVLQKSGRSTGTTEAMVDGEGIYRVRYVVGPGGVKEPRDILGFKLVPVKEGNPDNVEVSEPGDSGSCWYHAGSGHAVGLHFAGETALNPAAEHAIACDMPRVLARLGLRVATFDDLLALAGQAEGRQAAPIDPFVPPYGMASKGAGADGAGPEQAGTISLSGFIWPNLKAAMEAEDPAFRGIKKSTTFKSLKPNDELGYWIAPAVNGWPAFQALSVEVNPAAFFPGKNFYWALAVLSEAIEDKGFEVT